MSGDRENRNIESRKARFLSDDAALGGDADLLLPLPGASHAAHAPNVLIFCVPFLPSPLSLPHR